MSRSGQPENLGWTLLFEKVRKTGRTWKQLISTFLSLGGVRVGAGDGLQLSGVLLALCMTSVLVNDFFRKVIEGTPGKSLTMVSTLPWSSPGSRSSE